MSRTKSNRFKYFVMVNGDIKSYHTSLSSATKEAEYYMNNIRFYGWADVTVCQILMTNGEQT